MKYTYSFNPPPPVHRLHEWPIGQQVLYTHPNLGVLTCHVRTDHPRANCSWFGQYSPPHQSRATGLVLAGTSASPLRCQLLSAARIVASLAELKYALRRYMNRYAGRFPGIRPDAWDAELVRVSNNDTDSATFALTFEWSTPAGPRTVVVHWSGGVLMDARPGNR